MPDCAGARTGSIRAARSAWFALRYAGKRRPGWLLLVGGLLLFQALIPALQVFLVSQLLKAHDSGASTSAMLGWVMWVTLVTGLSVPMGDIAVAGSYRMVLRLRTAYEMDLDSFLAGLDPDELADPRVSDRVQAARGAAAGALPWQVDSLLSIASATVTAISLFVAVWVIEPWAAVLVVAAMVPAIIAYSLISQVRDRHYESLAQASRRADYLGGHLSGRRTSVELASLGTGWRMAEMTGVARKELCAVEDGIQRKLLTANVTSGLGTALLLGGALSAIVVGDAHGAGVAAGILGVISGIMATRGAASSIGRIMTDVPEINAYIDFLESLNPTHKVPVITSCSRLSVEGLTYQYPTRDEPAIKDVCFQARRGQVVGLVGANGAGKTTAVHCLIGALRDYRGRITVDGLDTAKMNSKQRTAYFGLMSQEFGRYELTVRQALMLGVPDGTPDDADLWRALRRSDADRLVEQLGGLDAQLGEQWGGRGISGGQWQRLALARIYLRGAGIWILDEPTSAIDAEAEASIFSQLHRERHGRITIVVTHRAWTLRDMDAIYVFDEGRIVEHGTYDQLLRSNGRFKQLFAQQAQGDIAALAAQEPR